MTNQLCSQMENRRQTLGISQSVLADRCGVSLPTVHRILTGHHATASLENVVAITRVLEMELVFQPTIASGEFLEQQARRKAESLVRMVQGTSALAGQGVDQHQIGRMVKKSTDELLAGSRRKLWAE